LGAFLRFHNLGSQSLFLDEAFSADLVMRSWTELFTKAWNDVHPFLFYVLLKPIVGFFPLTEWTLRLLPAFCSLIALAVAIGIARRWAGNRAAFLVGLVLAWSSLHLYYAQEARMYPLLDLLWLLSPWFLMRALESGNWRFWALWGVFSAAAIHTQFYGILLWLLGGVGSSLLIAFNHHRRRQWKYWMVSKLGIGLLALPLVALVFSTYEKGVGGTWVPTGLDPIRLWLMALFGFSPVRMHFLDGHHLTLYPWEAISLNQWIILGACSVIAAAVGWWRRLADKSQFSHIGWGMLFGVGGPALSAISFSLLGKRFWAYRPLIGSVSWLLIILAIGWADLRNWIVAVVLVFLIAVNSGPLYAFETIWDKDSTAEAFRDWEERVPADTTIVLDRYYNGVVWNFYSGGFEQMFGISPTAEGDYVLKKLVNLDGLSGDWEPVDCSVLLDAESVGLYDPAGRRFYEGWPTCVSGRSGWLFDPSIGQWRWVSQLGP
jgi:hypothetical protein